ncbi:MAG: aldose epimerase family protein [Planctomycetota bacterium]
MSLPNTLSLAVPLAIAAVAATAYAAPQLRPTPPKPERIDAPSAAGTVDKKDWGEVDGKPVHLWTLRNGNGLEAEITDYGTIIVSLKVPDAQGSIADVVLGRESAADYVARTQYFGCTAGRCANRIAGGKFSIDGKEFTLATNNGANHLHGGVKGFDKVVWKGEGKVVNGVATVEFTYRSKDGEEGYPGNVDAKVVYALTPQNTLDVTMTATTDAPTVVNMAHHSYWNLAGHGSGDILGHVLMIPASRYTPVDGTLITTGEIAPVKGTPLDFTAVKLIGQDFAKMPATKDDPGGYDHNFVLDQKPAAGGLWLSAVLIDPKSGRSMQIWSDQPGIQFYTGNFLDGIPGKGGAVYQKNGALCLETQAFPDSINKQGKDGWPNVVLRPGQTYTHRMSHRFQNSAK